MPPMVMRICLRCWPYTGRTMKRSNARPMAPAASIATSIAKKTATRFRHNSCDPVQSPITPNTLVATKAPSAMKTPWPKFNTSISPNTSVRPEAMMKIIMPIASPATVSVSHVEPESIKGNASSANTGTSANGFQSRSPCVIVRFIAIVPAESVAGLCRRQTRASCRHAPRDRYP